MIVVEDPARHLAYEVRPEDLEHDAIGKTVHLRSGERGSSFELLDVHHGEGETVYRIGGRISDDDEGPYPEPDIGEGIKRLENAFVDAGGKAVKVTAWAEGEAWLEHAAWLRRMLREQRAKG
jgi:hypothetical protein